MTTITLAKSAGNFASGRVLKNLTEDRPSADAKPDWTELDPTTLNGALRLKYEKLLEARKAAAIAKAAFEDAMNEAAAPGQGLRLVFGYNFGKLSIAVVPADRPKARTTKAAVSFADYVQRRA